ncbi:MAG TPA: hypothetical protein PLM53_12135 [Spirochaetota bacterium]|nr:hypothetical protein [Spirochaetota bacterium]HPC39907.1 hypothetical protein [Spirochaetota bacterium]HPL18838.1 hypothetical protein [Spirochaetota bacterium]HQF08917.1 hypothetical protein [Spirochaetota bacterium]HQH97843.1 hypothetical protein [Spirochaetota bacterium]
MRQSGDTYHAGVYLSGKLRTADEKRDKLLDVVNRLTQLSYEKGTRAGDAVIRKKIEEIAAEIERYYRMVRAFTSGKVGDTYAYQEILGFFNERYLEKFHLTAMIEALRKEIADQDRINLEQNPNYASLGHSRKNNIYARKLEEELKGWERTLLYSAEPVLRMFLNDVNDIFFYHRINARIGELISRDNVFATSGEAFHNFKASIGYFLEMNIKINRKPMGDKEIGELIILMMQQMGLRNALMHTRNITPARFDEIVGNIIGEWNLRDLARRYAAATQGALDAIRSLEKDKAASVDPKELKEILEDLCYMGDPQGRPMPKIGAAATGLAGSEQERYLFHSPGTFNMSLKFVSEYVRNSLVLVVDFLNKELQKSPASAVLLKPMTDMLPAVKEFTRNYSQALAVSEHRSNQITDRKGTRLYISRQMARELIQSIKDNSAAVRSALVDTAYKINNSSLDKSGVLGKKIAILQEAWNETHAKISKGLSEMGRA